MEATDQHISSKDPGTVILPAPTAWPFVMALGVSLIFAGLLTNASISVLGAILYVAGAVGWFREILPHEQHEVVRVVAEPEPKAVPAPEVMRLPVAQNVQRAWLPLKIYPISACVKGGLAGGVVMALLAMLYGL